MATDFLPVRQQSYRPVKRDSFGRLKCRKPSNGPHCINLTLISVVVDISCESNYSHKESERVEHLPTGLLGSYIHSVLYGWDSDPLKLQWNHKLLLLERTDC